MKFSQRVGITPITKSLQLESIDEDLINSLWNGIKTYLFNPIEKWSQYGESKFDLFCKKLWHEFYKLPIDSIPGNPELYIRSRFFQSEWFEIYDFLEFVGNIDSNRFQIEIYQFQDFCNRALEKEFSAYRFINGIIAPISNKQEISEIETAINTTSQFSSSKGANIHLKTALDKLSDKINPDYRNSIKESISAVESITKAISGNVKDTLGSALDKIKGKIKLHSSLERGFKQLYGYTSDSDGIRHALQEETNCDFEDAKFMLVSCSAFINYLIIKADKAGIKL